MLRTQNRQSAFDKNGVCAALILIKKWNDTINWNEREKRAN